MTHEKTIPTVFISYSWRRLDPNDSQSSLDQKHLDRVRWLGDQLIRNGVNVLLDQYELRPGDDNTQFMEKVAATEVDHVLAVCEPQYKKAFDARARNVGAEAYLMTPHLYAELQKSDTKKKFIPLLFEKEPKDQPYSHRPAAFAAKIYVDFTHSDEAGLEDLLRFIFDQPRHAKPPLGEPPKFS